MVDWATQDRLYPSGYQLIDIRRRRISVDASLPYSVASNKRHNCRPKAIQKTNPEDDEILIESLHQGLNKVCYFSNYIFAARDDDESNPKLLATYASNINWPRSVCYSFDNDGSIIVCEQDRCRLLLFTSQLMLRSTCGGKRGNATYEFDSPWSVAALLDPISDVLVADTNNRRIQYFSIGYDGRFLHKDTLLTKEKPYFVATSQHHFAVSCEQGHIKTFLAKKRTPVATIDLTKSTLIKGPFQSAFPLCMDPEQNFLFISNPTSSPSVIYQLTIVGAYLRSISLDNHPFLRISSLIFDIRDQLLVIADSMNSLIYSLNSSMDENNVELLLKRSDNVICPQSLCIGSEGHLILVECSVTTQHTLKIFRHHPCSCHSRVRSSSLKTSETTSVRSKLLHY